MKLGVWEWRLHYRGDVDASERLPDTFEPFWFQGKSYGVEALEVGSEGRAEVEVVDPDWQAKQKKRPMTTVELLCALQVTREELEERLLSSEAGTLRLLEGAPGIRELYDRYLMLLGEKRLRGIESEPLEAKGES